ncbi:MAG: acetoacetate--CoA ligase, partial [Acidobacteria bacterium]|nr:acetoacetate--CoA ligase [Acidobacteriota bacterium]
MWEPSPGRVQQANLTAFTRAAEKEWGRSFPNFASLYRWSVERPEEFWASLWNFCGVVAGRKWDQVVVNADRMPGAKWFVGARLNFAENLLRRRDQQPALIFRSERGERREISCAELYDQTARLAHSLKKLGITQGDRVVGFLPNIPEAVIAMLAASSLGAIWSSCSPEFGLRGILDRFGQITPKVLFTADGYTYNGKAIDSLERVRGIAREVPTLEKVVVVPYLKSNPSLDEIPNATSWQELLSQRAEEIQFEQLPFDHPVYILYTSGTTGVPKCIVHGGGGALLQHMKEHRLHTDLKAGERIFYFSTCGWMMWNWLVSALASEATVILYDGSPMHPGPQALFDMAAEERINVFGTSAGYLAAIEKAGLEPRRTHDLSALKAILSTGSPLAPRSFDYVYEKIK